LQNLQEKGEGMENLKLKGLLRQNKKTYSDAAECLGISINSFSSKINGKTAFTCWEAYLLSDFLSLSESQAGNIFLRFDLQNMQEFKNQKVRDSE
jgi:hypothetical protein